MNVSGFSGSKRNHVVSKIGDEFSDNESSSNSCEGWQESQINKNAEYADNKDNSDDESERNEIRGELASMTFEEIIKLKETLGSKVYNEAIFGDNDKRKQQKRKNIVNQKSDLKRLNKNRPREMSSKKLVPLLGGELRKSNKIIETTNRDPRYDEKCGYYDSKVFRSNYNFIGDIRRNEIHEMKKMIPTATPDEKTNMKFLIQRLENQNREEKSLKLKDQTLREEMININKAKAEGRQPHYVTKKERRTKELVKQFEDLKSTGRLQKHLEKRRKKNTTKDRKKFSFD